MYFVCQELNNTIYGIKKANLRKRIHPYKNDILNNLWPQKPVRYLDYLTNFGRAKTFVFLPKAQSGVNSY